MGFTERIDIILNSTELWRPVFFGTTDDIILWYHTLWQHTGVTHSFLTVSHSMAIYWCHSH